MKRVIFTLLVITIVTSAQAKYSGGTGAPGDPYQIATAEDLNDIGNHVEDFNKCFILVNDINLAQYDSNQFNIIGDLIDWDDPNGPGNIPFAGVFDGCGYKIINFKRNSNLDGIGLFGFVDSNGQILNTCIENADVNGNAGVGSLIGLNRGLVDNCCATGKVIGRHNTGGLVGKNAGGLITRCHSDMNVIGRTWNAYYIGGLVGLTDGNIADCHSSGSVSAYADVGGLIGCVGEYNYNFIERCSSDANVSGSYRYIGGLVGTNYNSVILCSSASGPVSGGQGVGGLIGYSYEGDVYDSSSSNSIVQGDSNVGGLIGYNMSDMFRLLYRCRSSSYVYGTDSVGGLVGFMYMGEAYQCHSSASVQGTNYVGGLVGNGCFAAWMVECSSSGTVTADGNYVGGLIGIGGSYHPYGFGEIHAFGSCSSASVSGHNFVGGLIGATIHLSSEVRYCYSMGPVAGDTNTGGLIGKRYSIVMWKSFWDTNTSGQSWSDGGTGKTTEEMKTMATFTDAGWDFNNIWHICETINYPKLLWQVTPADLLCPDGVTFIDYSFFAQRWLETDCASDSNCEGTDLDLSGIVDIFDLAMFARYWLLTDSDPEIYFDFDGDGYAWPASYCCLHWDADCDDNDPNIHPGVMEICANGKDDNCNGLTDCEESSCYCADADGDGYGTNGSPCCPYAGFDCTDNNPNIHPGATEVCNNGIDDDCDSLVDCNDSDCFCFDQDGDGYGANGSPCCPYAGIDCNDNDPAIHPGATEICDGKDNDCDSIIDNVDMDNDGYIAQSCGGNDCNDNDFNIHPGATETCDGKDNDCDSIIDNVDMDDDGYIAQSCGGNDCNDNNPNIHPGATEVCNNGKDDDCDGLTDCNDTTDCSCADADGDGYGTNGSPCCLYAGIDCNDNDPAIHPGATEVCNNGIDDDCDSLVDCNDSDCFCFDQDGDGYGANGSSCCPYAGIDCNDNDPNIHPGATEVCNNGKDDDCDGLTDCNDSDCSGDPCCPPNWPECWNWPYQCHGDADNQTQGPLKYIVYTFDLQILEAAFGTSYPDLGYNPCADFDRDGDVDNNDLAILQSNWMARTLPTCTPGGTWPP